MQYVKYVISALLVETNPCSPSPCGANSQCREVKGQAACSCLPSFIGAPPNCRPECVVSSECPSHLACANRKCINPCENTCGENANCNVINHSPICVCKQGLTGNPFTRCYPMKSKNTLFFSNWLFLSRIYFHFNALIIFACFQYRSLLSMYHLKIPVYQHHVVYTLSVGILAMLPLARVCPIILAVHQTVGLSVQSILNAPVTRLAWMKSVAILVRERVG